MPRAKNLKYILFIFTILLLVFGLPEFLLRIRDWSFYYNFSADLLGMPLIDLCRFRRIANRTVEFDRELFWKFKPNQILDVPGVYLKPVRINKWGFRGKDFELEKPEGRFRIICLGDSVTFGWSVGDDETYPFQLEQSLRKKYPNCDIEVINLGITGYTSFQGKMLFKKFAKELKPDLVIFGFGPNDRYPALLSDQEHYQYGTWEKNPLDLALSRLQIYKLLKSGIVYLIRRSQGLSLNPKTFLPRLKRKVSPKEYKENFAQIYQECQPLGCEVILLNVDFPNLAPDPVYQSLFELAKNSGAELPENFKEWRLIQTNSELAKEFQVPLLDIRALFKAYSETSAELMIDQGHPNAYGHKLIALHLIDIIVSSKKFQNFLEKSQP